MRVVHYELYVLEGRGWMLHARFPRTDKDAALAEGRELEQSLGLKVRVMCETYYTDDNTFDEKEVYISPGAPRDPSNATIAVGPAKNSYIGHSSGGGFHGPKGRSQQEILHLRRVFTRLLILTLTALAFALLAIKLTPDVITLLWKMGWHMNLTPQGYSSILGAVFTITFFGFLIPLLVKFYPRKPGMVQPGRRGNSPIITAQAREQDRKIRKSVDKMAAEIMAEEALKVAELAATPSSKTAEKQTKPVEEDKAARRKREAEEAKALAEREKVEKAELARQEKQKAQQEQARAEAEKKAREAQEKAKAELAEQLGQSTEAKDKDKEKTERTDGNVSTELVQPMVLAFINGAVAAAKSAKVNLDAYNKFALHLYVTGAVDALCDFRKLGAGAKGKLVTFALETLGAQGDLARKFYDKIDEYVMEPRYLGVIQTGRDAMGDYLLGNQAEAHRNVKSLFEDWNKRGDSKKGQIVTVMFTDMVGSTDLTQDIGDEAAQEVVRHHNSIVRKTLAQFQGKEIKHTGDGIMASFVSAANCVDAAAQIQAEVARLNARMPDLKLSLRIGMNAGEPIAEEDDLFGSTVQLAARVCAATEPNQILCTGVVKELASGKGTNFLFQGEQMLKGFKDPVTLYEVPWQAI